MFENKTNNTFLKIEMYKEYFIVQIYITGRRILNLTLHHAISFDVSISFYLLHKEKYFYIATDRNNFYAQDLDS